ncbi:MAG TPA: S-layer homology domain-containing protein [Thermoanaerobaculia bacterium]|nr:S-layer homology domain-containing protein [Thermoanaerobaculia bacterium]
MRNRVGTTGLVTVLSILAVLGGGVRGLLGNCGPFTDVAADVFCPFVLEIFYLGITTGTTATTYDPTSNVSRLQMAAFLSRTVDGALKRGSRRASLDQFWTSQNATVLGLTTVGTSPVLAKSDGADVWVANFGGSSVSRVRASDGRLLETWTGMSIPFGVLPAMGRILVTGKVSPGQLYSIDPTQAAGAATAVASNLPTDPRGIAFDGARVWTANGTTAGGSVSIVTPGASIPWTVTTITTGFTAPQGALFDGTNVWVTDFAAGTLLRLDPAGVILLTVTVGGSPRFPIYDGSNIWVPNFASASVSVVRASSGALLQTITGNGLGLATSAAFDGQRVLIANQNSDSVSLFKAADLTPLGSVSTGAGSDPFGACSDGIQFWVALSGPGRLARF